MTATLTATMATDAYLQHPPVTAYTGQTASIQGDRYT
jgi:hypothetical protein